MNINLSKFSSLSIIIYIYFEFSSIIIVPYNSLYIYNKFLKFFSSFIIKIIIIFDTTNIFYLNNF